jgi:protein translocase SecG subunit
MMIIANILPYIQIILSIILIVAVLMQQSDAGTGGVFGGGDGGGLHHTRRGFEKFLFLLTIVISILFALSSLVAIFVR